MNLIESVARAFPETAYDEAIEITGEGWIRLHATWRHPAGPLRRDAPLWEEE